jgi:hypothetical protein
MSQNTPIIILAKTTAAAVSDTFIVGNSPALSVICNDLSGAEVATVQYLDPIDDSWHDLVQGTTTIQFTNTIGSYDVWDSGLTYRVSKPITALPVGVAISRYVGAL